MQSKSKAHTSRGQRALRLFVGFVMVTMLWACANIGMPEGGPFDTKPPRLISASPSVGALQVREQRVELSFDEFVKLNQQDKIIISPPQKQQPLIESRGKSVTVKLLDSLRPNTTYSLYFDDVVVDNNEDNPLEDFSYTFSTGSHIDTMQIGGIVLDAEDLEPVGDLVVGAYQSSADSIAIKQMFPFAGKTSKQGKFTIRGLQDSVYSVFALKDNDNDYKFDGVAEGFAFLKGKTFRTTKLDSIKTDTIKIDSIVRRDTLYRDSLVTYNHTYYRPDDVVLRYFTPKSKQKGLQRSSREDSLRLVLDFYEELRSTPTLHSLDKPTAQMKDLFVTNHSGRSVTYWLRDRELMAMDSMRFAITYTKTDSLLREEQKTDTLTFYKPRHKAEDSKKKGKDNKEGDNNPFKISLSGAKGIFATTLRDSLTLSATYPIEGLTPKQMLLEASADSVYKPQAFTIQPDSSDILRYNILFERKYGMKYRLSIDSATITSIYGHKASGAKIEQQTSAEAELGGLKLSITGISGRAFAQLLGKEGAVLMTLEALAIADTTSKADSIKAKEDSVESLRPLEVLFSDLKPDDYYVRLFLDENADGVWTTGDYPSREPEMMYYSPSKYPVKKGFTTSESWAPLSTPLSKQKPQELLKTKPEEKKKREDKNKEYQKRMDEKKKK